MNVPVPPNTQALIFDCDGTLADTMPGHYRAWVKTVNRHGLTFDEDYFYSLGGVPSEKIVHLLAQQQGKTVDHQAIVREKEQAFLDFLATIQGIEPVMALARRYHGVLPMAVASGGKGWMVRRILQQVGILDLFTTLVCAEDTARHKPDPDVFLEAARRLGVAPAHCAVYEDTDIGLEAARRAGMTPVDVRRWHTARASASAAVSRAG